MLRKVIYTDSSDTTAMIFGPFDCNIEKLEAQLAALDAESEANATDYQKLMELDAQKQTLNTQLEALYEAWEALCD